MIERTSWVRALTALPVDELINATDEIAQDWILQPKSMPQSGLGMLKVKESTFNENFYLGEFCLSSAWIEVTTADGQVAEGAAQVMDDRVELAEALALCDAILSVQLPGWEKVLSMVEQGLELRNATDKERKTILMRTQVDFALLDEVKDMHERMNDVNH